MVFTREYCKIFKSTYFKEHLRTAVSVMIDYDFHSLYPFHTNVPLYLMLSNIIQPLKDKQCPEMG